MILLEVAINLFTRTWFRIRSVTSARQACRKIAVLSLIRSQRQLACEGLYASILDCMPHIYRAVMTAVTACSQLPKEIVMGGIAEAVRMAAHRASSKKYKISHPGYDCDPLNDAGRTRPSISDAQPNSPSSATSTVPSIEGARELPFRNARQSNLVGLFNDDTCPSGHISRPTHVNVSQSCFRALNKLLKPNYIFQVRGLVEVNKCHQVGKVTRTF